jgi:hypothetical protein
MTEYKSDLLRLLYERGYIHQLTDAEALDALAARQVVPAISASTRRLLPCTSAAWYRS